MIEFVKNLFAWIVEHKNGIITFLTSAEFIAFVGQFVFFFKNHKQVKTNTDSNKVLSETIKDALTLKNTIDDINAKLNEYLKNYNSVEKDGDEKIRKLQSLVQQNCDKINAIIDVQSIVYSTIKDEDMRTSVSSILTNAKYAEIKNGKDLIEQLQGLKDEVKGFLNDANKNLEEKVKVAEQMITDKTNIALR